MTSVLIHCSGNNPGYVNIVNNLIKDNKEYTVVVIDYSEILNLSNDLYYRKFAKFLSFQTHLSFVNYNNVKYFRPKLRDIDIKINLDSIPIDLKPSLRSALITLTRDDKPPKNFLYRRLEKMLQSDYLNIYNYLNHLFSEHDFEFKKSFVPNGRFPHQVVMQYYSNKFSDQIFYYERGLTDKKYFLENYMSQNRKATIKHFNSKPLFLWDNLFAKNYISNLDSLQNKTDFNKNWSLNSKASDNIGEDFVAIFLSSIDEFAALGNDWNRRDHLNQYDAIKSLVKNCPEHTPLIVRCHPNLITKSLNYLLRELRFLFEMRKITPSMKVVSPTSNISSYSIVKRSRYVIVWDSTIGLEAAALGKVVINLAPSLYSESIDTIDLSTKQLDKLTVNFTNYMPNRDFALNFINFLFLRNKDLEPLSNENSSKYIKSILTFPTGGGTSYLFDRIIFSSNVIFNRLIFRILKILYRSIFY